MSEIQFVRAGARALSLLTDIFQSATRPLSDEFRKFLNDEFVTLDLDPHECSSHYLIGFKNHHPFGYINLTVNGIEAEIRGPFLYPDHAEVDLAARILRQGMKLIRLSDAKLLYTLAPHALFYLRESYVRCQFEEISDERELIRQWRDGLLSGREIPPETTLLASLADFSDPGLSD